MVENFDGSFDNYVKLYTTTIKIIIKMEQKQVICIMITKNTVIK